MTMHALVVYESMYGNTHTIAGAIGAGLEAAFEVDVVPVGEATPERVAGADLLVVGGPTHVHTLSSERSRQAARDATDAPTLDPDAEGVGLRDWFDDVSSSGARAAAFDTRIDGPAVLTGRASKGIARRLRHRGFTVVAEPESFLVTKQNRLVDGEADRARTWGATLAAQVAPVVGATPPW